MSELACKILQTLEWQISGALEAFIFLTGEEIQAETISASSSYECGFKGPRSRSGVVIKREMVF